jgi:PTS system mannose-specific IIA component
MIGLVLVTHGRLAVELVSALEHVVGPQENVETVCIGPDDDMEQRRTEIVTKAGDVDDGDGVIEVIAGVNLPMLIKLGSIRDEGTLADAAKEAQDAGRKYINIASQLLAQGGA